MTARRSRRGRTASSAGGSRRTRRAALAALLAAAGAPTALADPDASPAARGTTTLADPDASPAARSPTTLADPDASPAARASTTFADPDASPAARASTTFADPDASPAARGTTFADPDASPAARGTTIDASLDPQFFALAGWSVGVGLWTSLPQLRITAKTFSLRFPKLFLGDANDGWSVRHYAAAVGAHYFLSLHHGGLFAGAQVTAQDAIYRRGDGSAKHIEVAAAPTIGYQWFPSSLGLFITPYIEVPVFLVRPDAAVADHKFHYARFLVSPSVSIGWQH